MGSLKPLLRKTLFNLFRNLLGMKFLKDLYHLSPSQHI